MALKGAAPEPQPHADTEADEQGGKVAPDEIGLPAERLGHQRAVVEDADLGPGQRRQRAGDFQIARLQGRRPQDAPGIAVGLALHRQNDLPGRRRTGAGRPRLAQEVHQQRHQPVLVEIGDVAFAGGRTEGRPAIVAQAHRQFADGDLGSGDGGGRPLQAEALAGPAAARGAFVLVDLDDEVGAQHAGGDRGRRRHRQAGGRADRLAGGDPGASEMVDDRAAIVYAHGIRIGLGEHDPWFLPRPRTAALLGG